MAELDASVIVICSGAGGLMPTALAHLEVQTYPAAQFEIIVVQDTANAQTRTVVERYAGGAPVPIKWCGPDIEGGTWGAARALNRALDEAAGRWVVFLDQDLLAGPGFVERHVQAQDSAGGNVAVVGKIELHPQVELPVSAKWRPELTESPVEDGGEVSFHDWRMHNLSLPRKTALEAGGFDEEFRFFEFGDVELASRLRAGGLCGVFCAAACAYAWKPVNFGEDRLRHYQMGYSIHTLLKKTPELERRLAVRNSALRRAMYGACVPLQRCLGVFTSNVDRPRSILQERVLQYELLRGYGHAADGQAPLRSAPR